MTPPGIEPWSPGPLANTLDQWAGKDRHLNFARELKTIKHEGDGLLSTTIKTILHKFIVMIKSFTNEISISALNNTERVVILLNNQKELLDGAHLFPKAYMIESTGLPRNNSKE